MPDAADGHGWELREGFLQPLWTAEKEELLLPDAVIQDLLDEEIGEENQDPNINPCESREDISGSEESDEDDI